MRITLQNMRTRVFASKPRRPRNVFTRRFIYVSIIILAAFSYVTNPFVKFTIVADPYRQIEFSDGQFQLVEHDVLVLRDDTFFRSLAYLKSGWHIFISRFTGGTKTRQGGVDEIIRQIHAKAFDPQAPFLISGDHFSTLYPRSLGIFYNTILDPRTALDETDWMNRQQITLKTLAYALQVFERADRLSTTIVPVGPRSVALLNFYAPPSDTLYSFLFAFDELMSTDTVMRTYPYDATVASDSHDSDMYPLATTRVASQLWSTYEESLTRHFDEYWTSIYDPTTGLVRASILLSGTKDVAKRESAFYDNVIAWRTHELAQTLGLIPMDVGFLNGFKQRILDAFWVQEEGILLEDLSGRSLAETLTSSDWMIAYQTRFFSPEDQDDLAYLTRFVEYLQRNGYDQPFALQYHPDKRPWQLYPIVRMMAPEYGSTAIWSNWGMEYIKLLTHLAQVTGDEIYLEQAVRQIEAYTFNIKRYRGFPEVYNAQGNFFRKLFYKSVRQTGWVVSFEQARAMVDWTREHWDEFPRNSDTIEIL